MDLIRKTSLKECGQMLLTPGQGRVMECPLLVPVMGRILLATLGNRAGMF